MMQRIFIIEGEFANTRGPLTGEHNKNVSA
jgi:hypothetical protein